MYTDKSFLERLCSIGKEMKVDDPPFECCYGNEKVNVRMQRFRGRESKVPGLKVEILDESFPDQFNYYKIWITLLECPTPNERLKVLIPKLEKHGVFLFDDPSMDETQDKFVLQKEFPKPNDFQGEYLMVCGIDVRRNASWKYHTRTGKGQKWPQAFLDFFKYHLGWMNE